MGILKNEHLELEFLPFLGSISLLEKKRGLKRMETKMKPFSTKKQDQRKPCRNSDVLRKSRAPHPGLGGGERGWENSGDFSISENRNLAIKKSRLFFCRNSYKNSSLSLSLRGPLLNESSLRAEESDSYREGAWIE